MYPLNHSTADNVFLVMKSGEVVQFNGIQHIETITRAPFENERYSYNMSFDCSGFIKMHFYQAHIKGMFDCIFGINSLASKRYKRWSKQQREKNRRKKLKGLI